MQNRIYFGINQILLRFLFHGDSPLLNSLNQGWGTEKDLGAKKSLPKNLGATL
jgi:hypothetical protein